MALDMKELRDKDEDALKQELSEMYKAGFSLRMQLATQQMTNSSLIRTTRRDIARIKTVLAEKAAAK